MDRRRSFYNTEISLLWSGSMSYNFFLFTIIYQGQFSSGWPFLLLPSILDSWLYCEIIAIEELPSTFFAHFSLIQIFSKFFITKIMYSFSLFFFIPNVVFYITPQNNYIEMNKEQGLIYLLAAINKSLVLEDPISPSGSFPSFPSVLLFAKPVLHHNNYWVFNITYSPSAFPKVFVYTSSYYYGNTFLERPSSMVPAHNLKG